MTKTLALLIFLALTALPLAAYCGEAEPLGLNECVRAALEKNHTLLSESEKHEAAKAGLGLAKSSFLPKVDVSETYMRSDNPVMVFGSKLDQGRFSMSDLTIQSLNHPSAIDNFNFRVQLTQPVYNGGKEFAGLKRADANLSASEKRLARAREETVFQAVQGYYAVELSSEYISVALKSIETTEGHLKAVQSMYDQGTVVGSEPLLARVRLAEAKEMLIKAKNREATARAALNMLMARPQDTDFVPTDGLAFVEFDGSLPGLIEEAEKARPDLSAMASDLEAIKQGVRLARTDYLPNINVVGRYDIDTHGMFGSGDDSYTVMGVLSWNIFDGFSTTNGVHEAGANYNSAMHMMDRMKAGVEFEVRRAYYGLVEARERFKAASGAVEEGEEGLRIIGRRFEAGMTRTIDVLDAEAALTRARTDRVQALYDYNVAVAALKLAVGRMEY